MFMDYSFVEGREAYISEDDKYAITLCDNRWMVQRSENLYKLLIFHNHNNLLASNYFRHKENCWKLALTEEDPQECPTSDGQKWRYKVEGQSIVWMEAGDGLQVVCAPGNCPDLIKR